MEIIGYGIISRLIDLLRKASPSVQTKVASFLEYLANFEPHTTSMTAAGIESGLDAVFQKGVLNGTRSLSLEA